jgi:hypothetical protein
MDKILKYTPILSAILIFLVSCSETKKKDNEERIPEINSNNSKIKRETEKELDIKDNPKDFVPKNFKICETVKGDLNKDGKEDVVILIKETLKSGFQKDQWEENIVDKNRRGLIVLLAKKEGYTEYAKNLTCFSSEFEDGGVYYPPELLIEIKRGSLFLNYAHGRYGYWHYQFKIQNNELLLIGYESTETQGPMIKYKTSINFLTKRKLMQENIAQEEYDPENGVEETFKDTWSDIKISKLVKLSEVKDFDELDFYD